MNPIPWSLTLLRLIVPVSILRFPIWGIMASIFTDVIDWNIIGVYSKEMDVIYQNWDKTLDAYTYFFIVWIVLHWKDSWARGTALGFFALRMVGQFLFLLTSWRPILFFFPNVFENFVILCLLIFWWRKKASLNLAEAQKWTMLLLLVIPKMIQEYFQHFLGRQPWEIYSLMNLFGLRSLNWVALDSILWGVVLYVLPMAGFLIYLAVVRRNNKYKVSQMLH